MNSTINSIGIYHPKEKVYNTYFEERLETSDKWIKERLVLKAVFLHHLTNIPVICVYKQQSIYLITIIKI